MYDIPYVKVADRLQRFLATPPDPKNSPDSLLHGTAIALTAGRVPADSALRLRTDESKLSGPAPTKRHES